MKIVFALFVFVALAAAGCEELLHCKSCDDSTHCKSCDNGYILDANLVCRYDCATNFGTACPACTDKQCICPFGYEWNGTLNECVDIISCNVSDGAACEFCGKGYNLIDTNGDCSTCKLAFGEGCLTCTESKCLTAADGYTIAGAVACVADSCPTTCAQLFPGCTQCNSDNTACQSCSETTVAAGGFCKFKKPTCASSEDLYYVNGKFVCSDNCSLFNDRCADCDSRMCTACITGYGISNDGKCDVSCSEKFPGCGICNAEECRKCSSSQWTLTPSGCFNQNPYSSEPEESNAGMIAGIVIACIVLVAIIIFAIYCIFTNSAKKGTVDPSMYEDDFEFKSQSVL